MFYESVVASAILFAVKSGLIDRQSKSIASFHRSSCLQDSCHYTSFFYLILLLCSTPAGSSDGDAEEQLVSCSRSVFNSNSIYGGSFYWNSDSGPVLRNTAHAPYKGTCAFGCALNVTSFPFPLFSLCHCGLGLSVQCHDSI